MNYTIKILQDGTFLVKNGLPVLGRQSLYI